MGDWRSDRFRANGQRERGGAIGRVPSSLRSRRSNGRLSASFVQREQGTGATKRGLEERGNGSSSLSVSDQARGRRRGREQGKKAIKRRREWRSVPRRTKLRKAKQRNRQKSSSFSFSFAFPLSLQRSARGNARTHIAREREVAHRALRLSLLALCRALPQQLQLPRSSSLFFFFFDGAEVRSTSSSRHRPRSPHSPWPARPPPRGATSRASPEAFLIAS